MSFFLNRECKNCSHLIDLGGKKMCCSNRDCIGLYYDEFVLKFPKGCTEFHLSNSAIDYLINNNDLSAYYPYARLISRYVR